ncbi:MAG TPA: STAS domain-containing protein [Bryobacteraceae bacterium]
MDMEIHPRVRDGITVLDLRGSLTMGPSEAAFRQAILALANAGDVNVILNCEAVGEIDEDGLGTLIFCSAELRKARGGLKLFAVKPAHITLIVLARLAGAFEIFADEQDAVNSFFPDRAVRKYDVLEFVKNEEEEESPPEPA